ncbi:MAG TPA: MarR family transcriptional regulator [Steroidobacteraceae bacterium]|jgi:MarR family transcriptional regulator for hemolysin|nr:MarR family transcriptional regulator [Steroidobacteraceae bacterium]
MGQVNSEQKGFTARPMSRRRSIALKLSVIARQMRLAFDQYAERSGLTRAKWTLIATVASRPGATQRQIAEALEVREITAGRLIDRLCEEGYLKRRENPTDRRAYCVHLTSAAQPVLDKLDEIAHLHETALFESFSNDDIERLDDSLDRLSRNIAAEKSLRVTEK